MKCTHPAWFAKTSISLHDVVATTGGDTALAVRVYAGRVFRRRLRANAVIVQCNRSGCRARRFAYFYTDGALQRLGPIFFAASDDTDTREGWRP